MQFSPAFPYLLALKLRSVDDEWPRAVLIMRRCKLAL